jgi:outer membrane protein TolC
MIAVTAVLLLTAAAPAQDTLRLAELHAAAAAQDARARQLLLGDDAHALRLENVRTGRLPRLSVRGEATHQSDAAALPLRLPDIEIPQSPRDRYQVAVEADQLVYDGGTLRRREAVERARHAEARAELAATLYALRAEVDEAFFGTLLLQSQEEEVRLLLADLDARLAEVRAQHRAGAALPGDTAAVVAERLRAGQSLAEVAAGRDALLAVLSSLAGRPVGGEDRLAVPGLGPVVARARERGVAAALRARPEFARFGLLRERLEREAEVVAAATRPQLRAFGQAGVGRPGPFQPFGDEVNEFWLVGVRLQWQPWTWGAAGRDRELLRVQQEVARTEEAAFAARLERRAETELHTILRLEAALETDERIIELRAQVERQARRQFAERVLTASTYLTARTDLFEARLARQRHRIELERARARYLGTLGIPLP